MARMEKREIVKSASASHRVEDFSSRDEPTTWRRAGNIKSRWSEPERRQRALIGQVKRNQLFELCFGRQALANGGSLLRQRVVPW